jgi:predicted enzyme related to lactoylglutathione lyase
MNQIGYFEIQSSLPEREIRFYQNIFGWNFIYEKNVPVEYYRVETNGINGGLMKRPSEIPSNEKSTNAFTNSIQVESFDKTSKLILQQGGKISIPKFGIINRCWQGYFTDPDNNLFGIFEVDENAR